MKLLLGIGLIIAAALEHNGATKVYIVGLRKEVLERAVKVRSVCIIPLSLNQSLNSNITV